MVISQLEAIGLEPHFIVMYIILNWCFKNPPGMFELYYVNKLYCWKAVWQHDLILLKQTWLLWNVVSMVPSADKLWKATGHSNMAM